MNQMVDRPGTPRSTPRVSLTIEKYKIPFFRMRFLIFPGGTEYRRVEFLT
ncbi:MAG: hypothetical protein QG561_1053 [Patescibacteria group bacterium]|nr:hypothetical protein [Patescibacteria group bacterium]